MPYSMTKSSINFLYYASVVGEIAIFIMSDSCQTHCQLYFTAVVKHIVSNCGLYFTASTSFIDCKWRHNVLDL